MRATVLLCAVATVVGNANFYSNSSWFMQKIRNDVMDREYFSSKAPPTSDREANADERYGGYYADSGTDVKMQIRFFKVQSVEAAAGKMSLKVWMRMSWQDTRLAWDPAEYGGVTETYYGATNSVTEEDCEIWIPDLSPYNSYVGLPSTLEPQYAQVTSDGNVFYSRPGTLDVMCKFSGLVAFPFDSLVCSLEVGGWMLSGGYQGIHLDGPGYAFSNQEATSGASYQEYSIEQVNVSYFFYSYPCCPSAPWPVVLYTITLGRASTFYFTLVLIPGILVTLLSFAVFWTDSGSADALGYGVGIVVVNLLSNVVLMEMLPVCGELLWVDMFAAVNTAFCCFSLWQSAFSIMLENHDGDHLVYTFIAVGFKKLYRMLCCCLRKKAPESKGEDDNLQILSETKYVVESVAGILYRQNMSESQTTASPKARMAVTNEERMKKLVLFENLFYKIDDNGNGEIEKEECDRLLSFCAMELDPVERSKIFDKFDYVADGSLQRMEFCRMCEEYLWNTPTELIEKMIENLDKAVNARSACNKAYWNEIGESIEKKSRIVCPMVYFFVLVVMFNLDMRDHYATTTDPMFSGITKNISIGPNGVGMILAFVIVVIIGLTSTYFINRSIARAEEALKEKQKQASRHVASEAAKTVSSRASSMERPSSQGLMSRVVRRSREMMVSTGAVSPTERRPSTDKTLPFGRSLSFGKKNAAPTTSSSDVTTSFEVGPMGQTRRRTRTSSQTKELQNRVDDLSAKLEEFQTMFQSQPEQVKPPDQMKQKASAGMEQARPAGSQVPLTSPKPIVVPQTPGSREVLDTLPNRTQVYTPQYEYDDKGVQQGTALSPNVSATDNRANAPGEAPFVEV